MSTHGLRETRTLASRLETNLEVSSILIIEPKGASSWAKNFHRKGGTSFKISHLGENRAKTSSQIASWDQARALNEVLPTFQYCHLRASTWASWLLKNIMKSPFWTYLQNDIFNPSFKFHKLWNQSSKNFLGGHFSTSTHAKKIAVSQSRDFSNAISFNIASLGETTNLVKTLVESLPSSNDRLPPTTCTNFASTGTPWLDGTTVSAKVFLYGWAEELGLLPEGKVLLETSFRPAEGEGRLPGKGEERDEVSVKEASRTTLFGRVWKIKPSEPISIKTKIKWRKEMQKIKNKDKNRSE